MLGDGCISLSKVAKGEGKYSLTIYIYSLNYLHHLKDDNYSQFTDVKFCKILCLSKYFTSST
jgi:hypothetical protein